MHSPKRKHRRQHFDGIIEMKNNAAEVPKDGMTASEI
jgi:hypothetical protein